MELANDLSSLTLQEYRKLIGYLAISSVSLALTNTSKSQDPPFHNQWLQRTEFPNHPTCCRAFNASRCNLSPDIKQGKELHFQKFTQNCFEGSQYLSMFYLPNKRNVNYY